MRYNSLKKCLSRKQRTKDYPTMETLEGEWKGLGIVETIYEEEHEDFSTTTPSLSLPPPTPLHSIVDAWSRATGCEADALIHIQGTCFHIHKDPLAARSGYLKRQLSELSEITLSPPLKITVETFTLVAEFCYGIDLVITPFNVAALRVAAELLEMTETNNIADGENLRQKTEAYFCRVVGLSRECASIIFRSCLSLLPEAETTAVLASRCIEALSLLDDDDGNDILNCIDDVKTVRAEDFQIVVESSRHRLIEGHDILYRIVDHYLKEHPGGKITEEQKTRICNSIDCSLLSPQLLMDAVQNPRMPLRFVVQAMFVEQLNTRHTILSAAAADHRTTHDHRRRGTATVTLGAVLQRDAAIRQAAMLKASMDATSSRIQSLEKELEGMRKLLRDSANRMNESDSVRSTSCRFGYESKIERGQKGSVSSSGLRVVTSSHEGVGGLSSPEGCTDGISPKFGKNLSRNLMSRLKTAFGALRRNSESTARSKVEADGAVRDGEEEYGNEDLIVIKKDMPSHRRSRSSNA